jgi:hypothetical protein
LIQITVIISGVDDENGEIKATDAPLLNNVNTA